MSSSLHVYVGPYMLVGEQYRESLEEFQRDIWSPHGVDGVPDGMIVVIPQQSNKERQRTFERANCNSLTKFTSEVIACEIRDFCLMCYQFCIKVEDDRYGFHFGIVPYWM
jgi:hypothetical protein